MCHGECVHEGTTSRVMSSPTSSINTLIQHKLYLIPSKPCVMFMSHTKRNPSYSTPTFSTPIRQAPHHFSSRFSSLFSPNFASYNSLTTDIHASRTTHNFPPFPPRSRCPAGAQSTPPSALEDPDSCAPPRRSACRAAGLRGCTGLGWLLPVCRA